MEDTRCSWCLSTPLYQKYHDEEWGQPVTDDATMFEFLLLEGAQAGLAWITVLNKRENYRRAFDNFDAEKIARYTPHKIERLLQDPGIIRNRLKVESAVKNARAYLALRDSGTSLCDFLWRFTGGRVRVNRHRRPEQVPATTPEADAMSKALKKAGFSFVGSTIIYAHMQATGMVNDHLVTCPAYQRCIDTAVAKNLL
ncbi:DNA-3-methyladenine glycosylase I [Microbulbifer thermotolerans]|uniref:DNA-3-methyladenine glycosylase I n=1 Tax=Microbulbifer thermotolerans TaxID=252514 RepID=UPI00224B2C42|nr:DNA-3-methyladenine glycosylase I [Microbulbifer thermotolerans]MCX2778702.1 DNA-3-methyladenine glycosylase I [Microbulbifer thermotolerans]MCX2803789.1 DNA-3-methyladenine glycosylase I [Microbulbifer thermotolerans]